MQHLRPLIRLIPYVLQYSMVQYSSVQYSTVQFSTVQFSSVQYRSGGSVVDNMLDYQTSDREVDPLLLQSFG